MPILIESFVQIEQASTGSESNHSTLRCQSRGNNLFEPEERDVVKRPFPQRRIAAPPSVRASSCRRVTVFSDGSWRASKPHMKNVAPAKSIGRLGSKAEQLKNVNARVQKTGKHRGLWFLRQAPRCHESPRDQRYGLPRCTTRVTGVIADQSLAGLP